MGRRACGLHCQWPDRPPLGLRRRPDNCPLRLANCSPPRDAASFFHAPIAYIPPALRSTRGGLRPLQLDFSRLFRAPPCAPGSPCSPVALAAREEACRGLLELEHAPRPLLRSQHSVSPLLRGVVEGGLRAREVEVLQGAALEQGSRREE